MRNPYNRVVVWYRRAGLRVRSCQTTVRPTTQELGNVTDFNAWTAYIRQSVNENEASAHLLEEAKFLLETI